MAKTALDMRKLLGLRILRAEEVEGGEKAALAAKIGGKGAGPALRVVLAPKMGGKP